jgi:drug/metabolite transporter (DMT)-like permease
MKYVPALTVAAVMLLGPLTATLEGIAVGLDGMPGPWTVAGAALVMLGSGLIAFTSSEQTTTIEIRRDSR